MHLLLVSQCGCGGRRDVGSTRASRCHCLVILLLRNFLFIDQLLVANKIALGLYVIRLGLLELGLSSVELLLSARDPGFCAFHVGFGG